MDTHENEDSPSLIIGEKVEVVLSERNQTNRKGKIREAIWHHKDQKWNYYLEENGKKVSKRYSYEDLRTTRC